MGEVYLAEDVDLNRQVAVKLVKAGLGRAGLIRHFRREETILAGLLIPILGVSMAEGSPRPACLIS